MIDKGFQKGIIQKIDTKNPNFNNFQGINALFVEYLKKLNVPFFNECCPAHSVVTPLGYRSGDVVVYNTTTNQWDVLEISGGGGSGDNFANADLTATGNRIHSFEEYAVQLQNFGMFNFLSATNPFNNNSTSFTVGTTNVVATAQSNSGNSGIYINDGTIDLSMTAALVINNDAGLTGQVITSQGVGLPPIWTNAGAFRFGVSGEDESDINPRNFSSSSHIQLNFNDANYATGIFNSVDNISNAIEGTGLNNFRAASSITTAGCSLATRNEAGTNESQIFLSPGGEMLLYATDGTNLNGNGVGEAGQVFTSQGIGLPSIWADESIPGLQQVTEVESVTNMNINVESSDAFITANTDLNQTFAQLNAYSTGAQLNVGYNPLGYFANVLSTNSRSFLSLNDGFGITDYLTEKILFNSQSLSFPTAIGSGATFTFSVNGQYADPVTGDIDLNSIFIPLAGTDVGLPVTGDIQLESFLTSSSKTIYQTTGDDNLGVSFQGNELYISASNDANNTLAGIRPVTSDGTVQVISLGVGGVAGRGLEGGADYSANYFDLTYVQKIYVDTERIDTKVINYELLVADQGRTIETNQAVANTITINDTTLATLPIGGKINIVQYGVGQTQIVVTGTAVLLSAGGADKIANQYGAATIVKRSATEFYLWGDITV